MLFKHADGMKGNLINISVTKILTFNFYLKFKVILKLCESFNLSFYDEYLKYPRREKKY